MINLSDLNAAQREAVEYAQGPLLIFAGAGSGKTRVITYRVASLILHRAIAPYRILAVTFTNKAANEMRERLQSLVGLHRAREVWVGTFHATCAQILRRYHDVIGIERDFLIYDDSDQRILVNRIVKDLHIDDRRYPVRMLLSRIHSYKQEAIEPENIERNSYIDDVVQRVFQAYEAELRKSNACDFDDLLLHVLRLVETVDSNPHDARSQAAETLRSLFQFVLVDEFQDTNRVQYRIVRALTNTHRNLTVVGDDDQSIYRWRGADIRNIRGFHHDYPEAHVLRLEQNYRSSARIVRAALNVIAKSSSRVEKELWTANDEGRSIVLHSTANERDEAEQIVQQVETWVREGLNFKEIAILYRIHAQSRVLEEAFRVARIPYRIFGGIRFYDRSEIKDILSYLRLIVNPRSDVDVLRIVNVPARGIGATTLEKIQRYAHKHKASLFDVIRAVASGDYFTSDLEIGTAPKKKLQSFVTLVEHWMFTEQNGAKPSKLIELILQESGYIEMLQADKTLKSETQFQNLAEFANSILEYEKHAENTQQIASITGFLERVALMSTSDDTRNVDDCVTLMTVHAAKGLEFEGVILSGLEEDLFPFKPNPLRDDPFLLRAKDLNTQLEESLEEERRLAYVAITRAKTRLALFHAASRTVFGQEQMAIPSRFFQDLSKDDVHVILSAQLISCTGGFNLQSPYSFDSTSQIYIEPPTITSKQPAQLPAASQEYTLEPDDDAIELRPGLAVEHRRYGQGRIVEVLEQNLDPKVIAEFSGWGQVTVLARFLKPISKSY